MRIPFRFRTLLGVLVILVLVAAACGGDDDDSDAASSSATTSATAAPGYAPAKGDAGDEAYVSIKSFTFTAPKSVEAGSKVEIRNGDSTAHTVTADDGSFDTPVDAGGEASFTAPSKPGTYAFHCNIHPSMKGQLVVT